MADLVRRFMGRRTEGSSPHLSFATWDRLPAERPRVVQICHPNWRGVRTVAYSFRSPVVETEDLVRWGEDLAGSLLAADVDTVVIQGWPPGAARFVERLSGLGITVKALLHSSPAQHGAEPGEAAVVDEVLRLSEEGSLAEVGMAKPGAAEAFTAAGHPVTYVPNRVPVMPVIDKVDLGRGFHVGVFAEPFWRKNVTTQLLAVGLLDDARAHVLRRPDNRYLDSLDIAEHGELPWEEFVALQGSVDINLYVTLSECHPSTPQESYLSGVPCLVSRVSAVFKSDPVLWDLTSVDEPDNPEAIAAAAIRLLEHRGEARERAAAWMDQADSRGADAWRSFTHS